MITRRGIGIGIVVVGIVLFGGRVVQKSFLTAASRLAPRMPIIRQGPHARHPFLQWVAMTSQQHGWALNRSDRLLVTWNGGHTWYRTPAVDVANGPSNAWNATHIQGFYALNKRDAWASTAGRKQAAIYHTSTGGRTWTKLHAPGVGWVDFLTPHRGWLLTFEGVAMGNYPSHLYDTSDGGRQWHLVASTFSNNPNGGAHRDAQEHPIPSTFKIGLTFQSVTRGWIAAEQPYYNGRIPSPLLYTTYNGGRSWSAMRLPREPGVGSPSGSSPEFFPPIGHKGLVWLSSSPFTLSSHLASTQQMVWYRTTDGGKRWYRMGQIVRATVGGNGHSSKDVSFISASDGWMLWSDPGQHLWHTVNGGHTWTTWAIRAPDHPEVRFTGINFITALRGWAISVRGQLWATIDGGKIWTPAVAGNS